MSWKRFLWWKTKKGKKRRQNVYSNLYSQAVTHPSTNRSQPCLTSVIGRELVYSRWYGRRHKHYEQILKWSTKNAAVRAARVIGGSAVLYVNERSPALPLPRFDCSRPGWAGNSFWFNSFCDSLFIDEVQKIFHFDPTWTRKAEKCKMSTATCIPRRSPIQVLTGLNLA